jgi:hypothetical protein
VPMAALSTIVKTATPTDPLVVVSGDGDDVSVFECETQPLLLLPTTQHEEGLQVLEDCPRDTACQ